MIARIHVNSPGFWEFMGSLNPLEVIRKALNDHHERKKDDSYRNSIEEQKLKLQNAMLHTELIQKQIDLLRSAGISDSDIQTLIKDFLTAPLHQLLRQSNIITGIHIKRE